MIAVVTFEPLTAEERRLIAQLYPRLSPAVAMATWRAWIAEGFTELEKWRFRADTLGESERPG